MGISVAGQQRQLIKEYAGVPNLRTAAKEWQYPFGHHGFDDEEQCRAQEKAYRKLNEGSREAECLIGRAALHVFRMTVLVGLPVCFCED